MTEKLDERTVRSLHRIRRLMQAVTNECEVLLARGPDGRCLRGAARTIYERACQMFPDGPFPRASIRDEVVLELRAAYPNNNSMDVTISNALGRLVERGLLRRVEHGWYEVVK